MKVSHSKDKIKTMLSMSKSNEIGINTKNTIKTRPNTCVCLFLTCSMSPVHTHFSKSLPQSWTWK